MPKLHLVIPNIRTRSGHNYQVASNMRQAALERGWGCATYLPRDLESAAVAEDLAGTLSIDHPAIKYFDDPAIEIGAANHQSYLDLARIAAAEFAPDDLVYISMVHHRNMFGIMRAFDEIGSLEQRPRLCLQLWSQQCFVEPSGEIHRRNSSFFAQLLGWCARNRDKCWPLWAFSQAHIDHLNSIGGSAAGVSPFGHIMAPIPDGIAPSRSQDEGFRFGYLGYSVIPEKGLAQWLSAAELVAARLPRARFTIHLDTRQATYDAAAVLERHAAFLAAPSVDVLKGDLDQATYFAALAACEVIVLPYGPLYDRQESGILHEACHFGKPVVAPARSIARSRLLAAGVAMPGFDAWTPEAIAQTCLDVHADYEALAAAVRAKAALVNEGTTRHHLADEMGILAVGEG
jgi:glycosyltransferase involved in cell wall biosynthesis